MFLRYEAGDHPLNENISLKAVIERCWERNIVVCLWSGLYFVLSVFNVFLSGVWYISRISELSCLDMNELASICFETICSQKYCWIVVHYCTSASKEQLSIVGSWDDEIIISVLKAILKALGQ